LTHVRCNSCGNKFNGRSGKDNTAGIVVYFAVVAVISLGLLVVVAAGFGLVWLAN
jgi:hypothetical protein